MASIQKRVRHRPDGTRYTRHIVRWRDDAGDESSETFKSRKAAEAFAARLELAAASGAPVTASRDDPTLAVWSERWLDLLAARVATGRPSPKTAEIYESRVRVHIVPRLGHHRLTRLSVGDVEATLTALQADGLAPATVASIRRTLSKMLTDAQKHELVDRNVAMLADPPTVAKRNPSVFTREETARILERIPHVRLGPLFLFVALTGLRASEARGLRWADVDLDASSYTVHQGLHRVGQAGGRVAPVGIVESHPKTDGSGHTTPLSPAVVELLREHRTRQARERLAAPVWHDRGYVFTNQLGGPLEPANVLRSWKALLDAAGITYRPDPTRRGRGIHELRRTYTTRLREAGIPIEDAARLGRWSSPTVLLDSYSSSSDERLRTAAQAVADAILGR